MPRYAVPDEDGVYSRVSGTVPRSRKPKNGTRYRGEKLPARLSPFGVLIPLSEEEVQEREAQKARLFWEPIQQAKQKCIEEILALISSGIDFSSMPQNELELIDLVDSISISSEQVAHFLALKAARDLLYQRGGNWNMVLSSLETMMQTSEEN